MNTFYIYIKIFLRTFTNNIFSQITEEYKTKSSHNQQVSEVYICLQLLYICIYWNISCLQNLHK